MPEWKVKAVGGLNGRGTLFFCGRQIAEFSNLASARTSARAWNRLLLRMLKVGTWKKESLRMSFQDWIEAASGGVVGATVPMLTVND